MAFCKYSMGAKYSALQLAISGCNRELSGAPFTVLQKSPRRRCGMGYPLFRLALTGIAHLAVLPTVKLAPRPWRYSPSNPNTYLRNPRNARSNFSGQPSARSGRGCWKALRLITRSAQVRRGVSSQIIMSARGRRRSKVRRA